MKPGDLFWVTLPLVVTAVAATMSATPEQVSWLGFDVPVLCAWRALTGWECPGCGLTRSFVLLVHGDVSGAFQVHALGPALYAAMVVQSPVLVWRRWRAGR